MSPIPGLRRIFRLPSRRARVFGDVDEELRFHLRMVELELIEAGMTSASAHAEARRQFGDIGRVAGECQEIAARHHRAVRRAELFSSIRQDIRYAVRTLVRTPSFTAVAVLTLGLGIGTTSAMFSVVEAVLLRPLPYPDADRLVRVWETSAARRNAFSTVSMANLADWRARTRVFQGMAAWVNLPGNLTGGAEPERITAVSVSANLFPLLQVSPVLGRGFSSENSEPGRDRVAILSNGLWRQRFGAEPAVIGGTLTFDGEEYTIVGVMPDGFDFPGRAEMWVPLSFGPEMAAMRRLRVVSVIARLRPEATLDRARADMRSIALQLEQQYPGSNAGWTTDLMPLREEITGRIEPALFVLSAAVGLVLLIACANVANLLLARATVRQTEMTIRTALGAHRSRLVRQLLVESVILALVGGGLGLLLATGGIEILVATNPGSVPRAAEIKVDAWALAFTVAASALTGILFGLVPAFQGSRIRLQEALRVGGQNGVGDPQRLRTRLVLVVAEIALATLLLIGAGLLMRSFAELRGVDPGFQPKNLLTMEISLPLSKYGEGGQRSTFFRQLLDRVTTLPGVRSAGIAGDLPIGSGAIGPGVPFAVAGQPSSPIEGEARVGYDVVSPSYFRTLGIALLRGRAFTRNDNATTPPVALINEALTRQFFTSTDPIGKFVTAGENGVPMEVVGVVGDVKQNGLASDARPMLYTSYLQNPESPTMTLVVRTEGDPQRATGMVRAAVQAIDADQPVAEVLTMDQRMARSVASRKLTVLLLLVFAGIGLALAAVGIYGVMSYAVVQRTREIGVRMALGAERRDILRMVVGQALVLTLVGIAIGLAGAFAIVRVLASLLYGVGTTDPPTYVTVVLVLTTIALLASYVPGHRATEVDVATALRHST